MTGPRGKPASHSGCSMGKKKKRNGLPQSNTGKMKSGAGRGRRQNQWRGNMKNTRGRRAAWTLGGKEREEREPSRQWGDSVLVREYAARM